jgi:hypothetical protein
MEAKTETSHFFGGIKTRQSLETVDKRPMRNEAVGPKRTLAFVSGGPRQYYPDEIGKKR